ncbi:NADPH nitroreductase [Alcaligenaceae bacterium]|nr:NADPH nitroreductase [Alcaligenaceae bacterium]
MEFLGKDRIKCVAAVGAGVIGAGWIAVYLARGYTVKAYDPSPGAPGRVRRHVATSWNAMASLGTCSGEAPLHALTFHSTLEDCVRATDFVHESTPEHLESKIALIRDIDALVPPDVLIASSTSSLAISQLQEQCLHPERITLAHPYNPVHLMPLVEIGGGDATDPAAVDTIEALYLSMGKHTIRVRKEIFGHITNRLASALFREAVWLVANGYATVGEIDDALRFGPALKWAIQGQYTSFHTTGGEGGFAHFLTHFAPGMIGRWQTMKTPDLSDTAIQERLLQQLSEYLDGKAVKEVAMHQDERLIELIRLLNPVRN